MHGVGGLDRRCSSSGCCGMRSAAVAVLAELAAGRQFEFAAERAVFLTVLHRLFVSGSDRAAEKWRADYRIRDGTEALQLHHLYRAMAWARRTARRSDRSQRVASPRCRKDRVEEELFLPAGATCSGPNSAWSSRGYTRSACPSRGQGGSAELGRCGHSKDHRPDLHQMIVGLVMDQDGRPLCCELWPGNTADVTTLLPVVDRLRARFGVEPHLHVVADRGMISAQTIAALEQRQLEYVLGVRERSSAEVRRTIIDDQTPFVPTGRAAGFGRASPNSRPSRSRSAIDATSSVAISPRPRRDAEQRNAILDRLRTKLAQGDKALVGNSGFPPLSQDRHRRALRQLDEDAGRRRRAL